MPLFRRSAEAPLGPGPRGPGSRAGRGPVADHRTRAAASTGSTRIGDVAAPAVLGGRSPVRDHLPMLHHALAPHVPWAASRLNVPLRLPPGTGGVALTFDDGPHPEGTPAVLEILARAGHRAMFFMVGEQVDRRPGLAREVAAQGHAIALHGYRHRLQLRLPERVLSDDLKRACDAIGSATGAELGYHRPPYGVYSPAGLRLVRAAALKPLLWSRWGRDWRRLTTPARIARRAAAGLRAGDVVLLHDADHYSARGSHRRTAEALELILAQLEAREIGTVLPV